MIRAVRVLAFSRPVKVFCELLDPTAKQGGLHDTIQRPVFGNSIYLPMRMHACRFRMGIRSRGFGDFKL